MCVAKNGKQSLSIRVLKSEIDLQKNEEDMGQPFRIPAGTSIQIAAPNTPLPREVREKIRQALSSIPGIVEVHLPMCRVLGKMSEPAHVLVVVLEGGSDPNPTITTIVDTVRASVPDRGYLDVWPLETGNSLLSVVRKVNCCLFSSSQP
jgi:hypothetical protein